MKDKDKASGRRDEYDPETWNEQTRRWEDELDRARQAGFGSLRERDLAQEEANEAYRTGRL